MAYPMETQAQAWPPMQMVPPQRFSSPAPMALAVAAPAVEEIEQFIMANELNERGANALQTAAPAVQRAVLDQGSLQGCRDTTAGCLGRIHRFQTQGIPAPIMDASASSFGQPRMMQQSFEPAQAGA